MKPNVIAFHYILKDKAGKTLESSYSSDPVMYLEGSGQLLPGLEKGLVGIKKGDKKQVQVAAHEGYGTHDKSLILSVAREQLPKDDEIHVGHQFRSETPDGKSTLFVVTGVTQSDVTLDGNHPLVDQDLTFEIEVLEVRNATDEELAHGHAHGAHGHHHH